ncbi:MAG: GTPase HflX [Planctomycetes bacterium]|nr:GTPase HflX [Planctomycetota bacterium]
MYDQERSAGVSSENAVLVRVILPGQQFDDDPLQELEGLATTAGTTVVAGMTQRREKPDVTSFVGKGKLADLKLLVDTHDVDVVIFDNDLTPAQTRNIEKALEVKVIDRTELILDIFATHAQTYESRLAVELVQLEYSLPRLKRMWTHLSRLNMGIGMRGPGEKQLEVDRRLVEKRIHDLRSELNRVERRKERQVAARSDHMTISLVGYTNAGKSTLMNALTTADVLAEDKLFATLDTRTRRWQLPHWGPVLLSDTVGFIRDLPHRLIASFKATLEEARQADLLLHIADVSSPAVFDQISAVYDVLHEIGIEEKDTLLVLNKVDALDSTARLEGVLHRYPNAIAVSAVAREALDKLAWAVSDTLSRSFHDVDIETGVENGKLMAYVASHSEVLSKRFTDTKVTIHCRIPQKYLGRINESEATIRPHESNGQSTRDATEVKSDAIEGVA